MSNGASKPDIIGLTNKIQKALLEKNYFWWGVVIGIQYGEWSTWRVSEKEEPTTNTGFKSIVRIKYLSPYDDKVKSRIVKWYDKSYKDHE